MPWYSNAIFYMGIFDAAVLLLGGLVAALVVLMGWDAARIWDRVGPAVAAMIGSNVAAAVILTATRWLITGSESAAMPWYSNAVLCMGILDAALLMIAGLVAALVLVLGWDAAKLWSRVSPALGLLIGSTAAAAIILSVTRTLLS